MKFIHLSDLHIGKRLNEFSLIDDQKYIIGQIIGVIKSEKPDGVIIAGDVYDKTVPSAEAVELFDNFMVMLSKNCPHIFIISGNHDSAERVAFGGRIMEHVGVHLSPVFSGEISPVRLEDSFGPVNVYMLPFIKPADVRRFFPDTEISTYTDAVGTVIKSMNVNTEERNILVAHQFVTGAERSESEDISIGGLDNVDGSVFDAFDYVALGHLHNPQKVGREEVRYSGTPLKYSFSEAGSRKTVPVITMNEKGNTSIEFIELKPRRDMVEIKGKFEEVISREFYEKLNYREDYFHVTLTDEDEIPDVVSRVRSVYTNLMKLNYDNSRTRQNADYINIGEVRNISPLDLFKEFYSEQNGKELSDEQIQYLTDVIEKVWGDAQ